MDFFPSALQDYLEAHSSEEPALLKELARETHLKVLYPRMLSGHAQGRFLAMVSKLLRPKRILEIGTYTGYSCLCLAEGLEQEGKLITLEFDPEREPMIRKYVEKAGLQDLVELRIGDARNIIPDLDGLFDLVFIDADKENYPEYFEAVLPKLNKGGIILADNVLWGGKVVEKEVSDADTEGIRRFNRLVRNHPAVECVLMPLRDGIMMVRKR